jgi:hypothetical protein
MAGNQTFRPPAFSDRRPGVKPAELQVLGYAVVRVHVQRAASEAPPLRGGSAAPHHKCQRELSAEHMLCRARSCPEVCGSTYAAYWRFCRTLAESEPCTISRAQSMQLTADETGRWTPPQRREACRRSTRLPLCKRRLLRDHRSVAHERFTV